MNQPCLFIFLITWSRGKLTGKFQTSSSDANNEARKFPRDSHSIQGQGGAETGGKCWTRCMGKQARTATGHGGTRPAPHSSEQACDSNSGTRGKQRATAAGRGDSQSLPFSTTQGKTPKQEREENTHTQAHISLKTLSQPSDYSGVDFPGDCPDAPTSSIPVQLSAQYVGFLKIKLGKRLKVNKMKSEDFLCI